MMDSLFICFHVVCRLGGGVLETGVVLRKRKRTRPPAMGGKKSGSVGFFRSSSLGLTIEQNHDPFRQCGRTSM